MESLALYEEMLERSGDHVDPRVSTRILQNRRRGTADYIRLSHERKRIQHAFWERYAPFDAVLAPTVAVLPPKIADLAEDTAYFKVNSLVLRNTMMFNFLGVPAVSVPCATTPEGLSIGFMIAARPFEENSWCSPSRDAVEGFRLSLVLCCEALRPQEAHRREKSHNRFGEDVGEDDLQENGEAGSRGFRRKAIRVKMLESSGILTAFDVATRNGHERWSSRRINFRVRRLGNEDGEKARHEKAERDAQRRRQEEVEPRRGENHPVDVRAPVAVDPVALREGYPEKERADRQEAVARQAQKRIKGEVRQKRADDVNRHRGEHGRAAPEERVSRA